MSFIVSKDFQIVIKCKKLNLFIDNALENVPNKDKYYKDLLRNEYNKLLYIILSINCGTINDKSLVTIKTQIAFLDYLIDRLFEKKYISEKKLYEIGNMLMEINKMCTTWIGNLMQNGSKT